VRRRDAEHLNAAALDAVHWWPQPPGITPIIAAQARAAIKNAWLATPVATSTMAIAGKAMQQMIMCDMVEVVGL
jgi:hypothetical protein